MTTQTARRPREATEANIAPEKPMAMVAAKVDPPAPAKAAPNECPEEQIRCLAYQKWETAGHPPGDGVEFWLEAEQELGVN